jgi:multiple antibiotic resistance protein
VSIFNIALTLFLVANPIGNSPAIIALIKDFDFDRQKKIMVRESLFALIIAIFFQYFGEIFLGQLHIQPYSVSLCGGILLFLVALNMIFLPHVENSVTAKRKEPMIVPIATPLISGPALLTIIMLFTQQEDSLKITTAILISWVAVGGLLMLAPYLQRILHRRGLGALEQLMGMILSMMAVEMIVQGLTLYIKAI